MASSNLSRWLRPEVYPLFAAIGVAVGICGFSLVRNICINPEVRSLLFSPFYSLYYLSIHLLLVLIVEMLESNTKTGVSFEKVVIHLQTFPFLSPKTRVNKENRAAGILDNFAEGEKYTEHALRKFVRNRSPEIMPSINSFFTDPK
ncbi:hypothetical protein HHK36_015218 [Tetracentron sinense]|uniref:Uncharacterized protein n=1 Tax=Tetracentron sinense TaxID=13715 RepID=A0A834Z6S5_TETSI|nr:hypothetical protein HHK36_015218 [Tetracentron sinense]